MLRRPNSVNEGYLNAMSDNPKNVLRGTAIFPSLNVRLQTTRDLTRQLTFNAGRGITKFARQGVTIEKIMW